MGLKILCLIIIKWTVDSMKRVITKQKQYASFFVIKCSNEAVEQVWVVAI